MKIRTHLISGAGNTFHIVYDEKGMFSQAPWSPEKRKELTRLACVQPPTDGFIFLEKTAAGHYRWHFYNNDSSDAEMCGNATRCVGYYIHNILKHPGDHWFLETVAGPIRIDFVENEKFRIVMTPIQAFSSNQGFFCDTGVPHLVLQTDSIRRDTDIKTKSSKLRFDPEFSPRGTNVTYVVLEADPHKVKAISFERGVEDFTDACGTGAMAAAFFNLTKRGVSETEVEMPGGSLMMNLSDLQQPTMTGPAILLGSYEYEISI